MSHGRSSTLEEESRRIFHFYQLGPLDQSYWADGLYTPPTDEALRWELDTIKSLGFNMLRMHVKVEPACYYYYCD